MNMQSPKRKYTTLKRLSLFTFITAIVIIAAIIAKNNIPNQYLSREFSFNNAYRPPELNASRWNILLDQHSHTNFSDGVMTPEQNVLWHIAGGFNACFITDHNKIEGAIIAQNIARTKYNNTIKVLVGEEWTTQRIHLNFLNITSTIPVPSNIPTDQEIQDAINAAHTQGGIVVVNHVPWMKERSPTFPSLDQLVAWGIDYIEVLNGDEFDLQSFEYCQNHGIGIITGTDVHNPGKIYGWTTLNVSQFTEEAILSELLARRTGIIYNFTGIDPAQISGMMENPSYTLLKPLIYLGTIFDNYVWNGDQYDWVGILVICMYLFGSFALSEFIRFAFRRWKFKLIDRTAK